MSATLASPLLARMSTWVPPAKSMPKFMPTNRNMRTEMIDNKADSGYLTRRNRMKPNLVFSGASRSRFMPQIPLCASLRSYRQRLWPRAVIPERDHHARHGHRGDDRGQNA